MLLLASNNIIVDYMSSDKASYKIVKMRLTEVAYRVEVIRLIRVMTRVAV